MIVRPVTPSPVAASRQAGYVTTVPVDGYLGSNPQHGALAFGEWLAIWTWRRVARARRAPGVPDSDDLACGTYTSLLQAEAAFRSFLAEAEGGGSRRAPSLAHPVSPSLTKDERRLLRALAAARAADEALMDNYLYKIALDRPSRARLAGAIRALAAALAPLDDTAGDLGRRSSPPRPAHDPVFPANSAVPAGS